MSTTTKSSQKSGVDLGPQSSLEEYLGGLESPQYSPGQTRERERLQEKIDALKARNPNDSVGGVFKNKKVADEIARLEEQMWGIEQDAQKKRYGGLLNQGIEKLANLGAQGAPTGLFNEGQAAGKDLAGMLQSYMKTGGLPGEEDVRQAGGLANQLFSARRTALQQSLEDQATAFAREQGRRGLMTNDPVFNAKLRTGFMRQQDMLGAEQQAESTRIAMGLPGQRLGFAAQRADTLSSLADRENVRYQQGLANLSALLGVGQGLLQGEQAWRLNTSDRWAESKQTESGMGPVMGAIGGVVGAAGSIMQGVGSLQQGTSFSKMMSPSMAGGGSGFNSSYFSGMPQQSFGQNMGQNFSLDWRNS